MRQMRLTAIGLMLVAGLFSCGDDSTDDLKPNATANNNNGGNGGGSSSDLVVAETQNAFVGYVGATWCGPCGSAGGPGFKIIKDSYTNGEVAPVYFSSSRSSKTTAYYVNGSVTNMAPFVNTFNSAMKSKGSIPYFNINGNNEGGAYTSAQYTADRYKTFVDSKIAESPVLGIAAKKTLSSDVLSAEVKVKAFSEYTGELYYSVLVVEKSVQGEQIVGATRQSDYVHSNIVRASLVGDGTMAGQEAFEMFASGTTAAGAEFSKSFTLTFDDIDPGPSSIRWFYDPANTEVYAMIWAKENGEWVFINSVVAQ